EATILSVRENTNVITLQQIDEAIDRVVAGPAKKHRIITKKELAITAYHEAGHAVLGLTKAYTFDVDKITIVPRGNAGGYNLMTPKEEKYNYSKSELEAKIMSFMGGRAAEQVIYGKGEVSTGASNDIEKATAIARAMVTQYGMSKLGPITYEKDLGPQYIGYGGQNKEYSDSLAEQIDNAVRDIILKAEAEAIETIQQERELLELIAEELLENETIVREQIQYIYKYRQRPSKKEKKEETTNNDKFTKQDLEKLLADSTTNVKKLPKKTSTKTSDPKEDKTSKEN
ncbi:MAG: AAA family ATPase, partial [Mycoplasma sp.]|nr:AAA family ATPase [Mycoplasma sp.]